MEKVLVHELKEGDFVLIDEKEGYRKFLLILVKEETFWEVKFFKITKGVLDKGGEYTMTWGDWDNYLVYKLDEEEKNHFRKRIILDSLEQHL